MNMQKKEKQKNNITPSVDNTFCYYPFSQLALKEWIKGKGIINAAPCCNSIRPEHDDPLNVKVHLENNQDTPEQIFNNSKMKKLREDMLNNKRNNICKVCWDIEDMGGKSYRLHSLPPGCKTQHSLFDANKPKLQGFDFGFGENCNLRCRMCYPGLSNKLTHDYKYFVDNKVNTQNIDGFDYRKDKSKSGKNHGPYYLYTRNNSHNEVVNWDSNHQWQNILDNIADLRQIKATGGETTLSEGFLTLIDHAIETNNSKNIMLEFHSNGTKFTNTFVEKMKLFGECRINISIDSIGKNYEYIRYPMNFSKLESSVSNLLDKWSSNDPPLSIVLVSVFSCLNAHYLYDLYTWWKKNIKSKINKSGFYIDKLWPDNKFINVKFLPKKQKLEILNVLNQIQREQIISVDNIIKYLEHHIDNEPVKQNKLNMLKEITMFDLSRNQLYKDYLHPSMTEYLDTVMVKSKSKAKKKK